MVQNKVVLILVSHYYSFSAYFDLIDKFANMEREGLGSAIPYADDYMTSMAHFSLHRIGGPCAYDCRIT